VLVFRRKPTSQRRFFLWQTMEQHFATHASQTANASTRTETLDGRRYLVVPVVALVAGVVNGELVPPEELAKFAEAWNGRPVPLRHPQDSTGRYISANTPDVIEAQVVGSVFNMSVDGDRLRGEMWLDIEKCERLGGDALRTLQRLQRGEVVEVSTSYFCEFEPAPGVFNGEQYRGIQRDLRPDHVALLPDEIGACSVADGCGAGRFNRASGAANCGCKQMKEESMEEQEKKLQANEDAASETAAEEQAATTPSTAELPAELALLLDALKEFGGVDALVEVVRGVRANQAQQKAQIVTRLAANSRCAFSRQELEAMPVEALEKLERSIAPSMTASYAGRNGAALSANSAERRYVRFDELVKK
jgi:hypothetical protein